MTSTLTIISISPRINAIMNTPVNKSSLVPITEDSHDLAISLAYASSDNFTGQSVYLNPLCFLHDDAAERLERAIEILKPLQLRIKIWDGFRPLSAQQTLFDHTPDPDYISDPKTGTRPHCRGIAIDLTLIDQFDNELDMGTQFDDFRPLAHHGNDLVSKEAQRNRLLLAGVMNIAGFEPIDSEWWHYQLPDAAHYPIIDEQDVPDDLTQPLQPD